MDRLALIESVEGHHAKLRCRRCGRWQSAEFCMDCRDVDPRFCADGLTARDIKALRHQLVMARRAERAMLLRAVGRTR